MPQTNHILEQEPHLRYRTNQVSPYLVVLGKYSLHQPVPIKMEYFITIKLSLIPVTAFWNIIYQELTMNLDCL